MVRPWWAEHAGPKPRSWPREGTVPDHCGDGTRMRLVPRQQHGVPWMTKPWGPLSAFLPPTRHAIWGPEAFSLGAHAL